MTRKLISTAILTLAFCANNSISAEPVTYERVDHYAVKIESEWYQKPIILFLDLAGLSWEEISIKTSFLKDKNGAEKVSEVSAWPDDTETENPDDSKLVFRLSNSTNNPVNFLRLIKRTKFKDEEIPKLLSLYNYLYDDNLKELNFSTTNLFEKEDGSMYCTFTKKIENGKNIITIHTLNSSGSENGIVEIVMNPWPEKHLEKISAQLKIGMKVTLTLL